MFWMAPALMLVAATAINAQERWTKEKANAWYARQPWLVGGNYTPATAINQLEMWQAASFDPVRIDQELKWARSIGMNTMRVFLHDLLWQQDAARFRKRIGTFLGIASKNGIRPMFVLFDSCWDPFPQLGKQREPKPGVHNSGLVQSPGARALTNPAEQARLEQYVKGVIAAFANDNRVLAWDLWNEPDNLNGNSYGKQEPANKVALVTELLPKVYMWARAARPSQPLTTGVWQHEWDSDEKLTPIERIQLEQSDIISFHDYRDPAGFERRIQALQRFGRPILCTEYMARGVKSTFEGSLPIAAKYGVAAYNWGLVQGKTQTHLPWDSWQQPYVGGREPTVWFHEVFRIDGSPYLPEETQLIRKLTTEAAKTKKAA